MSISLPLVASMLMNGGLQKLLGRLQQNGKGATGHSWVSTGPNEPIDAADVKQALDDQELADIAQQLGVSEDEAAAAVAQQKAQAKHLEADFDGEMQVDAALVPEIAQRKDPGGKVGGAANGRASLT